MSKILGYNVILNIRTAASPAEYSPIGCARTADITVNTDTLPSSTKGSGTWAKNKPIRCNWGLSAEGLCTFDQNLSIITLRGLQQSLTPVWIQWEETDQYGVQQFYEGEAILTSVKENKNYNDVLAYNISAIGNGELFIDPPYGNYPGAFQIISVHSDTPVPGETTLSLVWNPATPTPTTYTIRVRNVTTSAVSFVLDIPEAGHTADIVVNSADSYELSIQSVYEDFGSSVFSPEIPWP